MKNVAPGGAAASAGLCEGMLLFLVLLSLQPLLLISSVSACF